MKVIASVFALGWLAFQDAALTGKELEAARAAIARTAESLEEVARIRADFAQEQTSLLLAEPVVSKGVLHLRLDPGCLVLEMAEPKPLVVRSDATSHQVHDPVAKRAERYLFESNAVAKAMLACFLGRVAELEEVFELVGLEAREDGTVLALRPRTKRVRAVVAKLEVELRKEDGAVVGITYANAEGETVSMTLSGLELDPEVPEDAPDRFARELPEGTELVVHHVETEGEE